MLRVHFSVPLRLTIYAGPPVTGLGDHDLGETFPKRIGFTDTFSHQYDVKPLDTEES